MERQRSFSIKSTRFLLFGLIVASSVALISLFSIWICSLSPSFRQDTDMQFNATPADSLNKQALILQKLAESRNFSTTVFKDPILIEAQPQQKPNPASGLVEVPTGSEGNFSVVGVKDSILTEAHVTESHNVSEIDLASDGRGKTVLDPVRNEEVLSTRNATIQLERVRSFEVDGASSNVRVNQVEVEMCDVTKGKWVFDESYPLYTSKSCPFIDEGFDCLGNERPDQDFLKWRWQPQGCEIPRFNASTMLELIRGKRLVFVGDSLNRNQYESMLCLLMGAVKDPKKVYETHKRRITKDKGNYSFRFLDYECTVEYYVTHFLVHESKAKVGQKRRQILRLDAVDRGSSRWRGADILVFNSAHWWSHDKVQAGNNYFQEMGQVHPHLDVPTAFRKALTTWASWIDRYINPRKTQVFFRSSAPSHFRGGLWNSGGHCLEATHPNNETLLTTNLEKNTIVKDIIKRMKIPVNFLNITSLTDYRIDGHPSIYGKRHRTPNIQDCSHWCLPGVPDTWNELLYFHLQKNHNSRIAM